MATLRCKTATFENIQAVIFDKDGTLADSELFLRTLGQRRSRLIDAQIPGVQDPLMMAFGVDARRINPAGLMAIGTRQENEIAAAAYIAETGRNWLESLEIARSAFAEADKYMQRKADQTPPFAGAVDLLKLLAAADLRLGILSADTTENVVDFIQRYELQSLISVAMGADRDVSKPNPAFLLGACMQLGVVPAQTLVVGDAQVDIQMARDADSAGSIGVTWGWSTATHLADASVLADSFQDIQV